MKVSGHLAKLLVKNGVNQKGKPWSAYSLGIDADGSGSVTWYGCGFKKPDVTEGQTVSFEANEDAKGYLQVNGPIEVLKTKSVTAKAVAAGQDARSDSIVRQHSSFTAAHIARDLMELEIVPMPAKNKRYEFYMELIEEVTNRLFVSNREAPSVEMLREAGAVDTPDEEDDDVVPPGPEDDDDDYEVV